MEVKEILELLKNHFQLEGTLEVIYSEMDAVYSLIATHNLRYVVKISHPGRSRSILDMESRALQHLKKKNFPYLVQEQVLTTRGEITVEHQAHHLRVFKWIEATILADCNPQSESTRRSIGTTAACLSAALIDFDDSAAHRFIKWDPSQVTWIKEFIELHDEAWSKIFSKKLEWIEDEICTKLHQSPKQINYNDINDYNLLCTWNESTSVYEVHGLIDCLDMVFTHRINELAIACTYAILYLPNPLRGACELVAAYQEVQPLQDIELDVLYAQILSRLMISLTVSAINRQEHPENDYLQVTDKAARLLFEKWILIPPNYAHYCFRAACKKDPLPGYASLIHSIKKQSYHTLLNPALLKTLYIFDFKVDSPELGNFSNYIDEKIFNRRIQQILKDHDSVTGIGRYDEVRPFYTTEQFISEGNNGPEWRTVHLGLDLFVPPCTPVYAPYDGIIHSITDNYSPGDYGPTLVLRHVADGVTFYTLYGHLSRECLSDCKPGQHITAGQPFCTIGEQHENGGWPPHLHFQIILDLLDHVGNFPGVAHFEDRVVWVQICPDPVLITGIASNMNMYSVSDLLRLRKEKLGYNLSLSYKQPLSIQRGINQYLLDHTGRRYLDTVNNVAHCGHEHPRIVAKGQQSMGVLNTNTRYLHESIIHLAAELTSRLDPSLSVCYFTNSGTEANELAIRLAKNFTQQQDILTMQWAYHGNSELMVGLSSYKFDRKGGKGKPPHTHVIPMPDPFRGIYSSSQNPLELYLNEVRHILDQLKHNGKLPVGLFAESILSCGGQIVYPIGFLQQAVHLVRQAGGIYIADEVQTGLGRTGDYFCAYEQSHVVPDIVTFGKPLGNGHPIGAVVCRPEIAAAFNNGMEYFNTFGGNPVSCTIAREVLQVLTDENLIQRAKEVGTYLKNELVSLKNTYPILADIRGFGFFLGIELMKDQLPATSQANYLADRMKTLGILMSTDGPQDNVIKFKPPMCFDMDNAGEVLDRVRRVLTENYMRF